MKMGNSTECFNTLCGKLSHGSSENGCGWKGDGVGRHNLFSYVCGRTHRVGTLRSRRFGIIEIKLSVQQPQMGLAMSSCTFKKGLPTLFSMALLTAQTFPT